MYSFYPFTYFTSYGIIRLDNHIRKRGAAVLTYQDIRKVKGRIEKNIGQRVKLELKKGRNKTAIFVGTIESTHPSIFTVLLDKSLESSSYNRVSYSYTDVLTKSVELTLCNNEQVI